MNTLFYCITLCVLVHSCTTHTMRPLLVTCGRHITNEDEEIEAHELPSFEPQASRSEDLTPWHRTPNGAYLTELGAYNTCTVRHVQGLLRAHERAGNITTNSPLSKGFLERLSTAIAYKGKILPERMVLEDAAYHRDINNPEHLVYHGKIVASLIVCSQLYYDTYGESANTLSQSALERLRICAAMVQEQEDDHFFKAHAIGDIGLQSFALLLTCAHREAQSLLLKNRRTSA